MENVDTIHYGREGVGQFNQFKDQLSKHFMIERPGMGSFIETLVYTSIACEHQILDTERYSWHGRRPRIDPSSCEELGGASL